eukprot:6173445-Pleurochrysis_carterae.AAC.1
MACEPRSRSRDGEFVLDFFVSPASSVSADAAAAAAAALVCVACLCQTQTAGRPEREESSQEQTSSRSGLGGKRACFLHAQRRSLSKRCQQKSSEWHIAQAFSRKRGSYGCSGALRAAARTSQRRACSSTSWWTERGDSRMHCTDREWRRDPQGRAHLNLLLDSAGRQRRQALNRLVNRSVEQLEILVLPLHTRRLGLGEQRLLLARRLATCAKGRTADVKPGGDEGAALSRGIQTSSFCNVPVPNEYSVVLTLKPMPAHIVTTAVCTSF